jgi:hypothetical protein
MYEDIFKFSGWVSNETNKQQQQQETLIEKQHKALWLQNSLDWLTK